MTADTKSIYYGVSVALLALLTVMCFFEINSLWLYGHDGFNGATNAHAARMMLEHDTWGLLKYYYDPGAPDRSAYYTRLPYLSNYMVAFLYWITGHPNSEALARLVPIVFSVLGGTAVWWTLRKFWGELAAIFGLLIVILCPVFTVYATMLDHEQGCFFFAVAYLGLYLSWLQHRDWRKFAGILVLATLAVQYDWTGYYIALPVALHAVGYGFWKADEKLSWRPEYTFAVVFSAVILLNVFGFFYAMGQLAGFDQLRHGLSQRSYWPPGYLAILWRDVEMMYTYPIFWLGVAWLLRMVHRWATGQARLRDFLPLVFLWAQLFRSLFFSQAGYIHIFWVYYGVGFLAFAGADLLEDILVRLPRWVEERDWTPWGIKAQQALSVGLVAAALGWAAVDSYKYFFQGHKTGGSLRLHYHDDFNRYVQYTHKVGELRPDGLMIMHNSFWKQHPQTDWYLGYPHIRTIRNGWVPSSFNGFEPTSVVFDIPRTHIEQWLELMSHHPVTILGGRIALIDLTSDERRLEALEPKPVEASMWYRYWTNFYLPPLEWVEDAETEAHFRKLYEEHDASRRSPDATSVPESPRPLPSGKNIEQIQRPILDLKQRVDPSRPPDASN